MKKLLTLSVVALMLAGGLAACSGEGGGTADPAGEQQGVNITPPAESNADSGAADSSDTGAADSGSQSSDSSSSGESSDAAGSGDSTAADGGDSSASNQ